MGRVGTARLAWAAAGISVGLAVAAVVLAAGNGESVPELVANHHAVGIVTALGLAVLGGLVADHLPGVALAGWLASWTNLPGIAISSTLVFQLFPDGRLPSPRWRPLAWLTVVATVVPTVVLAARAWPLRRPDLAIQTIGHPGLAGIFQTGLTLALVLSLAPWPPWSRFRRPTGVERQQIKWFAYGAMIGLPLGVPSELPFWGPIMELAQPPLMVAGLGIGIFRYRRYDIDRLLNRTLVYGLLNATLAARYAAGVLVLGRLVSGGRPSSPVVAATTLTVAAAFQPLRRGIQRADALTAELLALVDQTVQPTRTSLWLRPTAGNRQT